MRKWMIAFIGVLGLCAFAIGALSAARAQEAKAASQPVFTYSVAASTDAPASKSDGQHLAASTDAAPVDADAAVSAVRTRFPAALLQSASKVIVGKYRINDDIMDQSIVPKDALVWVVTLEGVSVPSLGQSFNPSSGKPAGVFHQLNVVIDAKTGAPLEYYSGEYGPK